MKTALIKLFVIFIIIVASLYYWYYTRHRKTSENILNTLTESYEGDEITNEVNYLQTDAPRPETVKKKEKSKKLPEMIIIGKLKLQIGTNSNLRLILSFK